MSLQNKRKPSALTSWWLLLLPVLVSGCGNWPQQGLLPDTNTEPDLAAITTVVRDIYRTEGQRRIIFLGTEDADTFDANTLAQARSQLEDDLGVTVRPESEAEWVDHDFPIFTPVLSETGEVGISIRLGRFRVGDDGHLFVTAYWSRSCGERAEVDYVLGRNEQGWVIIDRDVRPDIMGCY